MSGIFQRCEIHHHLSTPLVEALVSILRMKQECGTDNQRLVITYPQKTVYGRLREILTRVVFTLIFLFINSHNSLPKSNNLLQCFT